MFHVCILKLSRFHRCCINLHPICQHRATPLNHSGERPPAPPAPRTLILTPIRVQQTFKLSLVVLRPDSGHVELLSSGLGQHPLQPLQRGLALLRQGRQALVAGVEGRHVAVAVL